MDVLLGINQQDFNKFLVIGFFIIFSFFAIMQGYYWHKYRQIKPSQVTNYIFNKYLFVVSWGLSIVPIILSAISLIWVFSDADSDYIKSAIYTCIAFSMLIIIFTWIFQNDIGIKLTDKKFISLETEIELKDILSIENKNWYIKLYFNRQVKQNRFNKLFGKTLKDKKNKTENKSNSAVNKEFQGVDYIWFFTKPSIKFVNQHLIKYVKKNGEKDQEVDLNDIDNKITRSVDN